MKELSAQLATYFAINRDASQAIWHGLLKTLSPDALAMIHNHIDTASPVGRSVREKLHQAMQTSFSLGEK